MAKRKTRCRVCGKQYGRRSSLPNGYCSKLCHRSEPVNRALSQPRLKLRRVSLPRSVYGYRVGDKVEIDGIEYDVASVDYTNSTEHSMLVRLKEP